MSTIRNFKELIDAIEELKEKKVRWVVHYFNAYMENIHNPQARLEYLYRLVKLLREHNIVLTDDLVKKLLEGKIE